MSLQANEILAALERHGVRYVVIGGLAAVLHGSPLLTGDADICPALDRENLDRLAAALMELKARIRAADAPGGLPFACDAGFLANIQTALNLTTVFGDLDLSYKPAGTEGFADLIRSVVRMPVEGYSIPVAALEDVIRSKEAAGRPKDHLALPTLRLLLDTIRGRRDRS